MSIDVEPNIAKKPVKIMLNMIMRDEVPVLVRGFETLEHIIDAYCVCDTGSKDDSINLVKTWMKEHGKEGDVTQEEWTGDFGYHRTLAMEHARKTVERLDPEGEYMWYAMFHDADNQLAGDMKVLEEGETKLMYTPHPWTKEDTQNLKDDRVRTFMRGFGSFHQYTYTWMARLGTTGDFRPWQWLCSRHEYLDDANAPTTEYFYPKGFVVSGRDGARGKEMTPKYIADAVALDKEINSPDCKAGKDRLAYYLACSYRDGGNPYYAAIWFERRTKMGGFLEEVYLSYLYLSDALRTLGRQESDFLTPLFKAMSFDPRRLEAPFRLLRYYNSQGRWAEAWNICSPFRYLKTPEDLWLPVDLTLYDGEFLIHLLKPCWEAGIRSCDPATRTNPNTSSDHRGQILFLGHTHREEYREIFYALRLLPNFDQSRLRQYIGVSGIFSKEEQEELYRDIPERK